MALEDRAGHETSVAIHGVAAASAEDQDTLRTAHLQKEIGYHLKRAYVHVIETFHRELREVALRPGEFSVMCVLDENAEVTAKKLSRALNIAPPNLVGLLETLKRRGLIARVPNLRDRRSQLLALTEAGRNTLGQAKKQARKAQNISVAMLSTGEREQLISLLKKIYHVV